MTGFHLLPGSVLLTAVCVWMGGATTTYVPTQWWKDTDCLMDGMGRVSGLPAVFFKLVLINYILYRFVSIFNWKLISNVLFLEVWNIHLIIYFRLIFSKMMIHICFIRIFVEIIIIVILLRSEVHQIWRWIRLSWSQIAYCILLKLCYWKDRVIKLNVCVCVCTESLNSGRYHFYLPPPSAKGQS